MRGLKGKKVFLVEDEALVAMLIEDMLRDLGCEIASIASSLDQGCQAAKSVMCDFAVLDVNLNRQRVFPIAHILQERDVPFVFSTGYGVSGIPDEFKSYPTLNKPFVLSELQQKIELALRCRSTGLGP